MNWGAWLVWGFASTIVLTTLLAGTRDPAALRILADAL